MLNPDPPEINQVVFSAPSLYFSAPTSLVSMAPATVIVIAMPDSLDTEIGLPCHHLKSGSFSQVTQLPTKPTTSTITRRAMGNRIINAQPAYIMPRPPLKMAHGSCCCCCSISPPLQVHSHRLVSLSRCMPGYLRVCTQGAVQI